LRQTATPVCLFIGPRRRATPRDALTAAEVWLHHHDEYESAASASVV
jgi:hypothetical protein